MFEHSCVQFAGLNLQLFIFSLQLQHGDKAFGCQAAFMCDVMQ